MALSLPWKVAPYDDAASWRAAAEVERARTGSVARADVRVMPRRQTREAFVRVAMASGLVDRGVAGGGGSGWQPACGSRFGG